MMKYDELAKDTMVKVIPQPSEKLPCTVPTHFFPNQHLLLLSPIHPVAWRVAFVLTVYKSGGVGSRIGVQPVPSEIASSVRCVLSEPDPESDDHTKYRADADCLCIQLPCERVALQLSTVDEVYTNDVHSFQLSADGLKACQNTQVLHDDSEWMHILGSAGEEQVLAPAVPITMARVVPTKDRPKQLKTLKPLKNGVFKKMARMKAKLAYLTGQLGKGTQATETAGSTLSLPGTFRRSNIGSRVIKSEMNILLGSYTLAFPKNPVIDEAGMKVLVKSKGVEALTWDICCVIAHK